MNTQTVQFDLQVDSEAAAPAYDVAITYDASDKAVQPEIHKIEYRPYGTRLAWAEMSEETAAFVGLTHSDRALMDFLVDSWVEG